MSLTRQCPPQLAKAMTLLCLGKEDETTLAGIPIHTHFATMSLEDALEEFDQVYQLDEGSRFRDLLERMGEDGTPR